MLWIYLNKDHASTRLIFNAMGSRADLFCINVCTSVYDDLEYNMTILPVYYLDGCPVNVSQNEGNLVCSWGRGLCRYWLVSFASRIVSEELDVRKILTGKKKREITDYCSKKCTK